MIRTTATTIAIGWTIILAGNPGTNPGRAAADPPQTPPVVSVDNARHTVAQYELVQVVTVFNDGTIEVSAATPRPVEIDQNKRSAGEPPSYPNQCEATAISTGQRCRVKSPKPSRFCRYHD